MDLRAISEGMRWGVRKRTRGSYLWYGAWTARGCGGVICSLIVMLPRGEVRAGQPDALPAGYVPHVRPVAGGTVNWGEGEIVACGLGKGRGRTARQMAERAATLEAARNALAISLGLKVDAGGTFANLRDGEVRLRGVVRGHKVESLEWFEDKTPLECIVKLRVPIWGAKGVASIVYADRHRRAWGPRIARLPLSADRVEIEEAFIVIDARGLAVEPCLFPTVVSDQEGLLYDVATVEGGPERHGPLVWYVETERSFEELRRIVDMGVSVINGWDECEVISAPMQFGESRSSAADLRILRDGVGMEGTALAFMLQGQPKTRGGRAASQPASQPASRPADRKRQRILVVKAVKSLGADDTKIVVTREDAERMQKSAEGSSLLRSGRVIVVVDSVAAGVQGRLDRDSTHLASMEARAHGGGAR